MASTIVPDIVKDQTIQSVSERVSAREAAELMSQHRIAALPVMEGDGLVGIVTERDVTGRLVAAGKDPEGTSVGEIMTRNPETVGPDASPMDVLERMRSRGYRHIPVTDEQGRVVAIVGARDLFQPVKEKLEADLEARDSFLFGGK